MASGIGVILFIFVVVLIGGIKILNEYERGVVFRLGRLTPYRGPGVVFIIPMIERLVRIDLRTVTLDIPPQDVITKDKLPCAPSAARLSSTNCSASATS